MSCLEGDDILCVLKSSNNEIFDFLPGKEKQRGVYYCMHGWEYFFFVIRLNVYKYSTIINNETMFYYRLGIEKGGNDCDIGLYWSLLL